MSGKADSKIEEKVKKLELLVEELLKEEPSENDIRKKMTELELTYTEDPVERINRVLEALHPFGALDFEE